MDKKNSPLVTYVAFISTLIPADKLITEHRIAFLTILSKVSYIFAGSQLVMLENMTRTSFLAYEGTAVKFSIASSNEFYKDAFPSKS